jgi:hypothetical protein
VPALGLPLLHWSPSKDGATSSSSSPEPEKSLAVPKTEMLLKKDEAPVLVEVVCEGDDEDEEEDDDDHDDDVPAGGPPATYEGESASAPETVTASSSLSPFAPPFVPECRTEGRPKSRRWAEDSIVSGEVGTDEESSPKALTYLDVVRRQPRPVSPPPARPQLRSIVVRGPDGAAGRTRGQVGGGEAVRPAHSLSMGFPSAARAMGSVACRSTRG